MIEDVGVAELRRNLSVYLRRVENGERFVVTDRNRPVAELGPVGHDSSSLDRLIAEGRAIPPTRPRRRRFDPIEIPGLAPNALTAALLELREAERW